MSGIREMAQGRWPMLLAALGADERVLRRTNGPCPLCPGGRDRYRFSDHEGRGCWFCSKCGKGDGFELLQRLNGWTFAEAAAEVEKLLPGLPTAKQEPKRDAAAALNRVRREAVSASQVPEVVRYLRNRGLVVPPGLAAHPKLAYYHDGQRIGCYPAMLGRVKMPDGTPITYHRTYLQNGQKARVAAPRKLMKPARPSKGGAVQLWPAGEKLGIAEGIETAIAAHQLFGIPVWSVISANGMAEFQPPAGVREVVIFGDTDESFTGQAAAYSAAKRLVLECGLSATVKLPPYGDWADVLIRQKGAA